MLVPTTIFCRRVLDVFGPILHYSFSDWCFQVFYLHWKLDLLNNCPPFGTYLRIATPSNESSKLPLELCIEISNFAAI